MPTTGRAVVLVFCGAACGRPSSVPPDPPPDAAPSPLDAGAEEPLLRVKVFSERWPGEPEAGARVLVARPGEPIAELTTGADGTAAVAAADGTTITIVQPAFTPSGIVGKAFATFVDVAPGMEVIAGPRRRRAAVASTVRFTLPPYPGGHFYTVSTPCESLGAGDGTTGTLTIFAPCSSMTSATLVGRVRDRANQPLAVSVLEDVDLLAADGTTIMMPAFDTDPTPITASVVNIPPGIDGPFAAVNYRRGHDTQTIWGAPLPLIWSQDGAARSERQGHPVGDSSSLDVMFLHDDETGVSRTDAHVYEPGAVSAFTLDATSMIRGVYTFASTTTTTTEVAWREHPVGEQAELVSIAVAWSGVRGIVVMPYRGTSISFDVLPAELQPAEAPTLWELHTWTLGSTPYREMVPLLEQSRDFRMWTMELPRDRSWWRASFVRPGLPRTPSITNEGTHRFCWEPAEDTYFRFATGEWLRQQSPPTCWRAITDGFGHLVFFDTGEDGTYHVTAQTVSGPVRVRVDIQGVEGWVDLVNETASWRITVGLGFNIPGVVTESSCRTSSFTVTFHGKWRVGTDSELFAIPALSGNGTQACAGLAPQLNTAFALGSPGALLHFYKFSVLPNPQPTYQ